MEAAAEQVNLMDFIRTLPEGFGHPIRERGSGLSTGQKQLISFARALAHNPRYLILDEATSSVDTETEFRVREALNRMVAGRTSIVIAHRLSTIQRADRILVMHKGNLRESGTHQELLAQRGIYWKLYQLQYKDQELAHTARDRPGGVLLLGIPVGQVEQLDDVHDALAGAVEADAGLQLQHAAGVGGGDDARRGWHSRISSWWPGSAWTFHFARRYRCRRCRSRYRRRPFRERRARGWRRATGAGDLRMR